MDEQGDAPSISFGGAIVSKKDLPIALRAQ
jgi:hypothetical protein